MDCTCLCVKRFPHRHGITGITESRNHGVEKIDHEFLTVTESRNHGITVWKRFTTRGESWIFRDPRHTRKCRLLINDEVGSITVVAAPEQDSSDILRPQGGKGGG
eukprot:1173582-Prorocentrum_minimum.AAC.5